MWYEFVCCIALVQRIGITIVVINIYLYQHNFNFIFCILLYFNMTMVINLRYWQTMSRALMGYEYSTFDPIRYNNVDKQPRVVM